MPARKPQRLGSGLRFALSVNMGQSHFACQVHCYRLPRIFLIADKKAFPSPILRDAVGSIISS